MHASFRLCSIVKVFRVSTTDSDFSKPQNTRPGSFHMSGQIFNVSFLPKGTHREFLFTQQQYHTHDLMPRCKVHCTQLPKLPKRYLRCPWQYESVRFRTWRQRLLARYELYRIHCEINEEAIRNNPVPRRGCHEMFSNQFEFPMPYRSPSVVFEKSEMALSMGTE